MLDRSGGLVFHPMGVYAAEAVRRLRIGIRARYSRVEGVSSVLHSLPGAVLADEILTPGSEPESGRYCLVQS
jgi:hypothetical protein